MPYEKFYRFYDAVMGDRAAAASYIGALIDYHRPIARSVLEIACGTGTILGLLSESYEVTGLDRSRKMLAIARAKLPQVRFYHQNMTCFKINRQFDAIVCVFDSINHVLRFSEWKRVFSRVKSHLKDDGIFVFDVNTSGKLQRLCDGPPWVKQTGRDIAVVTVTAGRRGFFNWNVNIFEHRQRNQYELHFETISELVVPMKRVVAALRQRFRKIRIIDPEGSRPSDRSQRLYFVCEK